MALNSQQAKIALPSEISIKFVGFIGLSVPAPATVEWMSV
jgi:hypothetical protein